MYDMDNDGVISKDELMAFLTLMVGSNVSQDQVTMLKFFY
jgi:Ca2+-binding EF-hand superfamily protein